LIEKKKYHRARKTRRCLGHAFSFTLAFETVAPLTGIRLSAGVQMTNDDDGGCSGWWLIAGGYLSHSETDGFSAASRRRSAETNRRSFLRLYVIVSRSTALCPVRRLSFNICRITDCSRAAAMVD